MWWREARGVTNGGASQSGLGLMTAERDGPREQAEGPDTYLAPRPQESRAGAVGLRPFDRLAGFVAQIAEPLLEFAFGFVGTALRLLLAVAGEATNALFDPPLIWSPIPWAQVFIPHRTPRPPFRSPRDAPAARASALGGTLSECGSTNHAARWVWPPWNGAAPRPLFPSHTSGAIVHAMPGVALLLPGEPATVRRTLRRVPLRACVLRGRISSLGVSRSLSCAVRADHRHGGGGGATGACSVRLSRAGPEPAVSSARRCDRASATQRV